MSLSRPSLFLPLFALASIAVTALVSGCSGTQVINSLTPDDTFVKTADIAYGANPRMRLDVYRPISAPVDGKAPVVVFFYGGSWRAGSKSDYLFAAEALAERGIVTVVADYRLYPEVRYPDFLPDCARAVAWTFKEIGAYGGDARRIFVAGHSAGAYNAAMIAYDPRWLAPFGIKPAQLRGLIGLAGPYNFLPIKDEGVKVVFGWPDTPPDSQPINHVGSDAPPSLLIAAEKDTFVIPEKNTGRLAARLRALGADVSVHIHSGVSHLTLLGAMSRPLRGLAPVAREFGDFVLAH